MNMKNYPIICAAFVATSMAAGAATIVTSYGTVTGGDDGNQAGPMFGQGITVNVGADTADGSITSTVFLKELSFQSTSSTTGLGSSNAAYIHVYDAFAVDGDNTPSAIGNLVAVSSNTVDLAGAAQNQQLTWSFSGTEGVLKGQAYFYVLATDTNAATVLDSSNLTTHGFELNTGNPYSGGQAYRANGTTTDWDMEFALTTDTDSSIPEPSSSVLLGLVGVAFLVRRRK